MLRKINAVFSLLTTLLLFTHVISMGLLLFGAIEYSPALKYPAYALLACFSVHALLSICALFFNKGASVAFYPRLNIETTVQRVTAILLIVLIHRHFYSYSTYVNGVFTLAPRTFLTFLPELLLCLTACAHTAVSVAKALVTLGVPGGETGYAKARGGVSVAVGALCCYALAALVRYFFFGG